MYTYCMYNKYDPHWSMAFLGVKLTYKQLISEEPTSSCIRSRTHNGFPKRLSRVDIAFI